MKALNAMHLKVPDDISVIGFGGIPEISSGYPNLTGVHYSKEAVGKQAMSLLVDKIKDKDFPQSNILIPMSIKKGNSCRKI
jgi:DNA-binding LacI/PurR family transcriptional regulator